MYITRPVIELQAEAGGFMLLRFAVLLLFILSGASEAQNQGVPPPLVPPSVGFAIFDESPGCVTTAQDLADGLDPCEHRVGDNLLINIG